MADALTSCSAVGGVHALRSGRQPAGTVDPNGMPNGRNLDDVSDCLLATLQTREAAGMTLKGLLWRMRLVRMHHNASAAGEDLDAKLERFSLLSWPRCILPRADPHSASAILLSDTLFCYQFC